MKPLPADPEAVACGLEASGHDGAAALIREMASRLRLQDEALRNLVADNEIEESVDEGGAYHRIESGAGAFDAFLGTFGYRASRAFDLAAKDPEDADVYLSALEMLRLRIENEGLDAAKAESLGMRRLRIGNEEAWWSPPVYPGVPSP